MLSAALGGGMSNTLSQPMEQERSLAREQRQLEELDFRRELQAKEDFERSKKQKWFSCVGESMLPEEKIRGQCV